MSDKKDAPKPDKIDAYAVFDYGSYTFQHLQLDGDKKVAQASLERALEHYGSVEPDLRLVHIKEV